jgi:hypothetical protein
LAPPFSMSRRWPPATSRLASVSIALSLGAPTAPQMRTVRAVQVQARVIRSRTRATMHRTRNGTLMAPSRSPGGNTKRLTKRRTGVAPAHPTAIRGIRPGSLRPGGECRAACRPRARHGAVRRTPRDQRPSPAATPHGCHAVAPAQSPIARVHERHRVRTPGAVRHRRRRRTWSRKGGRSWRGQTPPGRAPWPP